MKISKLKILFQSFLTTLGGIAFGLLFAAFLVAPVLLTNEEIIRFWSEILK